MDSIFAKEREIQAEKGKPIPLLIPADGTYQIRVRALGIGGYIDTRVTLEIIP